MERAHQLLTDEMPAEDVAPDASTRRAWELAQRVIELARGLVVADNPFLSSAIGLLSPAPARLSDPLATDGKTLHIDTDRLLDLFARTRVAPVHDLTHVLLHCMLLHPFVGASVDGSSWDLAADIVAESLTAEIMGPRDGKRGAKITEALDQLAKDLGQALTTERLYRALRDGANADVRHQWDPLFHVDDHGLRPSAQQASTSSGTSSGGEGPSGGIGEAGGQTDQAAQTDIPQQAESQGEGFSSDEDSSADQAGSKDHSDSSSDTSGEAESDGGQGTGALEPSGDPAPTPLSDSQRRQAEAAWSRAGKSLRVDLETLSRTRGSGLGGLRRELDVSSHERVDYRDFLRQFAVEHEDMRLSDDEFDYIFYTYGLELYHDMPLIEPLEYRSDKRIRDFAIVIDTSSSVSDKVVQEFVNTTFDVLSSEGGFFAQTNIHIIQADARVQSDAKITSLADLDRWRRTIKLYGFGGTDFRPAFAYVRKLRQAGEFEDLQGLIYFTDGWGIYPDRMPPYKCAFVFYDEDHRPELVPPWAIQVVLHPGEYESLSVY